MKKANISQLARDLAIDRTTLYNWRKVPPQYLMIVLANESTREALIKWLCKP